MGWKSAVLEGTGRRQLRRDPGRAADPFGVLTLLPPRVAFLRIRCRLPTPSTSWIGSSRSWSDIIAWPIEDRSAGVRRASLSASFSRIRAPVWSWHEYSPWLSHSTARPQHPVNQPLLLTRESENP